MICAARGLISAALDRIANIKFPTSYINENESFLCAGTEKLRLSEAGQVAAIAAAGSDIADGKPISGPHFMSE